MRESQRRSGPIYVKKAPRVGDHGIRLIRSKYGSETFPAGLTRIGTRRKRHTIWAINYLVTNVTLTAIAEKGVHSQNLPELLRLINEKLIERFGGLVTCSVLQWLEDTFAYNAKLVVRPISEDGKCVHTGLVWNILFWDVETAAKQFEELALPTLAPMVLVRSIPALDLPWKYGQAVKTHGFRFKSTLPGRNRVRTNGGEGNQFVIDDTLTVKGTLYAGTEYARLVTATLSYND